MQQFPPTARTRIRPTTTNTLPSKEQYTQRYPKPPSIPRSQSSKDLQEASRTSSYFKSGRRVLHRNHSFPDVRCTSDLKLPKATTSFSVHRNPVKSCVGTRSTEDRNPNNGLKKRNIFNGFKGGNLIAAKANNNGTKEKPGGIEKRKEQQELKLNCGNCEKPSAILNETVFDLDNNPVSFEHSNVSASKRHAVFFINHEDGRLQALSNLRPVPEEPEHQRHVNSPWQCYSDESCLRGPMGKLFNSAATNQELADSVTQKSPWNCYGDESNCHVIDKLFDSDEEGFVVRQREIENNGLDPVKKAMINNWILDVKLNAWRPKND